MKLCCFGTDRLWQQALPPVWKLYVKSLQFYAHYFTYDSPMTIVWLQIREMVEIILQTCALYYYGGSQNSFIKWLNGSDDDTIILAEKHGYVQLFCYILCTNCVLIGILWLLYLVKHKTFHGTYFKFLIFSVDTLFDICFAIFPFVLVNNADDGNFDIDIEIAIGALNTQSTIIFVTSYFPMCFLMVKLSVILTLTTQASHRLWRHRFIMQQIGLSTKDGKKDKKHNQNQKQKQQLSVQSTTNTNQTTSVNTANNQNQLQTSGTTVGKRFRTSTGASPTVSFVPTMDPINNVDFRRDITPAPCDIGNDTSTNYGRSESNTATASVTISHVTTPPPVTTPPAEGTGFITGQPSLRIGKQLQQPYRWRVHSTESVATQSVATKSVEMTEMTPAGIGGMNSSVGGSSLLTVTPAGPHVTLPSPTTDESKSITTGIPDNKSSQDDKWTNKVTDCLKITFHGPKYFMPQNEIPSFEQNRTVWTLQYVRRFVYVFWSF